MSTIINGSSPSITFSDGSTQSKGISSVNPVFTGDASISGLTVGKGGGAVASNTAVGGSSLNANTTGSNNTAVGYTALNVVTTGADNSAFGFQALKSNTGSNNTAYGSNALVLNTSGGSNTGLGYQALLSNTTASNNTAVGYQAGYSNTTTTNNTFIGVLSGYATTSGYNTFVGTVAGYYVTTGAKNTILGAYNGNQSGLDIRTNSNFIVLSDGDGNPLAYTANNSGWYKQNNTTTWSTTSDRRIKENIVSLEKGLDVINALNPVTFDYIQTKKPDVGFIAQEYKTVLPEQVEVQQGINDELNELIGGTNDLLSINQNLTPYLVKAIQELKAELDATKAEVAALKAGA